jgi:hypothetical protein
MGIAFLAVFAVRTARRSQAQKRGTLSTPSALLSSFVPFYLLLIYLVQPVPDLLQAGTLLGGVLVLSLLLRKPPGLDVEWSIGLLLFFVSLIAYLNTLMPGVGTRDGYELQAISATLGFAHPTGYPLFPLLGRLWIAIFSFGTIAWRINVLCALFAALSVPLVYGTARSVLDRPFSAWSALLFAFSHTLWTQASQPEKYTLNVLFVALTLYVAFGASSGQRGPHPHLRWLAFVYGLSLTHHRTMLMLAPALALYLLWRDPCLWKRPKEWLPALGIAVAPLLIYLYIPWRAHAQGWTMTLSEFLRYIAGAYYGPAVRLMDWANPERALMFWRFASRQFGYVGIGLGVLGMIGMASRRQWRFLACTALAYITYYFWGTVWYAYYNDVNSFLPNHLIFSIWVGSGAMSVWRALAYFGRSLRGRHVLLGGTSRQRSIYASLFWSLAALMPMWLLWTHGPQVDQSDRWERTRWGERVITSDLVQARAFSADGASALEIAPHAIILADREKYPPLDYFARIERHRPDVTVVLLGDEQAYLDRLAKELAPSGSDSPSPVYLARFLPGLEGVYHLSSVGPLVRVSTQPITEIRGTAGTPINFASGTASAARGADVELLGFSFQEDHGERTTREHGIPGPEPVLAAGESLRVTLFWRTDTPVPGNYHVALRLVSTAGHQWWASSDHPVNGMYPTAALKRDEIVADWHEIPIDHTLPPGNYTLEAGLFLPFSEEGLPWNEQGKQWAPLTRLTVTNAPDVRIPHRLNAVAPGRLELLGYDLPDQAPPLGRATLELYWHHLGARTASTNTSSMDTVPAEIGTRMIVKDAGQQSASLLAVQVDPLEASPQEWDWQLPGKGEYPISSWAADAVIVTEHSLTMPAQEGRATVQIAVRERELVSFYPRWLAPMVPHLSLPPIQIAGRPPAAPGTTNFGDLILLLEDDLGQRTLAPGSPLELSLRWQGLRPMEANYTLFIHILAPDGTLKGQIDVWPKDGTHPTSQWQPGETFEDRYTLYVDSDAPPGTYQVAIGWYLLETMQRLPVLDAQGKAIDDKVLLSGLTVE